MSSDVVVDALHTIVFGGIAMTASALHRATGGQELTFTQWRAILFVGETAEGSRVSDVADRLMGTLSATSRLLRRLEDRGLLTLDRDETDRRATRARLTEDGRRLREAVLGWRRQQIVDITRDVTVAPGGRACARGAGGPVRSTRPGVWAQGSRRLGRAGHRYLTADAYPVPTACGASRLAGLQQLASVSYSRGSVLVTVRGVPQALSVKRARSGLGGKGEPKYSVEALTRPSRSSKTPT